MLPTQSSERIPKNTPHQFNEKIYQQTEESLAHFAAGRQEEISERLLQLDKEWDIERALMSLAGTFGLTGLFLGTTVNRKWLYLPLAVSTFLLQHSIQGWCPPLPVLRWLGFRTQSEIDKERYALKLLRGDFLNVPTLETLDPADTRAVSPAALLDAVERS